MERFVSPFLHFFMNVEDIIELTPEYESNLREYEVAVVAGIDPFLLGLLDYIPDEFLLPSRVQARVIAVQEEFTSTNILVSIYPHNQHPAYLAFLVFDVGVNLPRVVTAAVQSEPMPVQTIYSTTVTNEPVTQNIRLDETTVETYKAEVKKEEPVKPPPPKKTTKELIDEVFEAVFPGNWYIDDNRGYYVHWPEFVITNSRKKEHTIRDLIVKMTFDSSFSNMTSNIRGLRITLNENELVKGYRHSHLPTGCDSFSAFCLGVSSMSHIMIENLTVCTPDSLFLFLVHLDQYVRWESLEGGPYIRIENLSKVDSSPANGSLVEDFFISRIDRSLVNSIAGNVIRCLSEDDLIPTIEKGRIVKVRLRHSEKLNQLIYSLAPSNALVDFNLETGRYFSPSRERRNSDLEDLKHRFLSYSNLMVKNKEGNIIEFERKILGESEVKPDKLIRVLQPQLVNPVLVTIETVLNSSLCPYLVRAEEKKAKTVIS